MGPVLQVRDPTVVTPTGPSNFIAKSIASGQKKLKCRSCQMWFPALIYMKHMRSVHKLQSLQGETIEEANHLALTCVLCPRHFLTPRQRDHHVRDEHSYNDTTCDFCFKNFNTLHGRTMHMRAHFIVDPNTGQPVKRNKAKVIF